MKNKVSFSFNNPKIFIAITIPTIMLFINCATKIYTKPELEEFTKVNYATKTGDLIKPLAEELSVVLKQIFFLKHDVAKLKDKLWDGGSNHRIMRIDDNIAIIKKEISKLRKARRELLNTIYTITPGYQLPIVIGYIGSKQRYEKIKKQIILVSQNDQMGYQNMLEDSINLSDNLTHENKIAIATSKFKKLSEHNPNAITAIGTKGPVKKISPKTQKKNKRFIATY